VNSSDTRQETDLGGQVAIVTGGGRGIGRAIALALARVGAAVAVVARSSDQLAETVSLIEGAGERAISFPADVTDEQATDQMADDVKRQLGPVDLLVNNAGIIGPIGPVWEADADEWWECIVVNLRGPFLCARAVLPHMVARHSGRIINVSSGGGLGASPYGSYGISKCALTRFSENLAVETKEHGISVFAIHPTFVRTAMTEGAAELPGDDKWLGGLFRRNLAEERGAPPERAAELVLLLASGRADALSGRFISVRYDLADMIARSEAIRENDLYTLRLRT
jgi:NAD(P)-dependent dehydrogenase (short-subunit alcohol dehydrogenase family)